MGWLRKAVAPIFAFVSMINKIHMTLALEGFKTPKKVLILTERILKIIQKGSIRLAKKGANEHEMLKSSISAAPRHRAVT